MTDSKCDHPSRNVVWVSYNREELKNCPDEDHYRCTICGKEWGESDLEKRNEKQGREQSGCYLGSKTE